MLIVPAALKDNLKCVSELKNERLVIAMCELDALVYQPLSFQAVNECIELGGPPECAPACGERFFFETDRLLADIEARKDVVISKS